MNALQLAEALRQRRIQQNAAKATTRPRRRSAPGKRYRPPKTNRPIRPRRGPGGKWRFSDEEVCALHTRYWCGETASALAREQDADRAALLRNFRRLGLPIRKSAGGRPRRAAPTEQNVEAGVGTS